MALHQVGAIVAGKSSVEGKKIGIVLDVLGIGKVEITFAEGKVINGIEDVCFSGTVPTDKTIDIARELERCLGAVFKLTDCQMIQMHIVWFVG